MKKFLFESKSIYYNVQGSGPALVLLHGFLESSTIWTALSQKLKDRFTIITIDLPGHGKSEVLSETHGMELMADVIHHMIQHLQLDSFSIIGHSMGGYVALAYAERYPSNLSNLILLNSTAVADSPERVLNRNRAIELLEQERTSFIGMAINNLFCEESRARFPNEIDALIKEAYSFPLKGIQANIRGMRDRKDRTEILKAWKKGKYLLSGAKDPLISVKASEELSKSTGTPIKLLAGSHMSWLEDLDRIVKIVHFIEFFDT